MNKIYLSLPAHTTKDFYEMIEPLDAIELECTCKEIKEHWKYRDWYGYQDEMCQSCKHYFENERRIASMQTLMLD